MPNSNITACVTSCNRHELLRRTLESFYAYTDIEPQELLICEDSDVPMPEFLTEPIWRQRNLRWLSNGARKGQIYSADRLMMEATHELIFWLEDDWDFTAGNFMAPSKEILNTYSNISMVSLRGDSGWHPLEAHPAFSFKIAVPYWKDCWGGWSFNCGLRRRSTWQGLGSFGKHVGYGTSGLGHESHLSKMMLDAGYMIADIGTYVEHTGIQSRACEPLPPSPKVLIAIPACFKFSYSRWESDDSPSFNQSTAWEGRGYGTGIHLSGINDRIQAVRDTWAKDVAAFPNVTLKFFYGLPSEGYPRAPLADEVFLRISDDYEHLPHKTIAICEYAVKEGYDFIFKADDDTAIYVDRLIHELLTYYPDYAGWENSGMASGGVGYWLSNRAARLVAENPNPDCWNEDGWVGKVMAKNGVRLLFIPTHVPGNSDHWYFPTGFDSTKDMTGVVTFHAVQPDVLRDWYKHKEGQ